MEYRILCGKEHKLVLSDDIYSENQFMYQAYCEARNALSEIVRYSDEFYGKSFAPEALFESLQNIIAFSGRRGQGKTSTMLSFSDALKYGNLVDPDLKEHTYEVLAPIDPTILEEKQNILALVLARMYRRADEIWAHGGSEYTPGHRGPTEADKNELLASFQRCLTGINAIKYKTDKEIKSLTDISIVSDSATLKQDIHDLIKKYLRFVGNADETKGFLVIQLDDTDFQVIKGHEIGVDTLEKVLDWSIELGIEIITVYAFSTENFNRPQHEVEGLMKLFVKNFKRLVDHEKIHKNEVKVKVVGKLDLIPENVREAIKEAEDATAQYDKRLLNIAIGYDGRLEIIDSFKKIIRQVQAGEITIDDVD